ncbi:MAG: hypothetical protein EPN82_13020 [Bacteroidetes bacterium]|nr:MAG: hypothetical protein EPN82_13020 [Bacteroidota bacterium]
MNENIKELEIYASLEKYVNELHSDYEVWYAKSVRKIYWIWYIMQILTAATGFVFAIVSSIAVALGNEVIKNYHLTIYLVILPAFSSASANIIIRFRIYDLWMIREQGRIEFQNLHNEGKALMLSAKSETELQNVYQQLVKRTKEIEDDQQVRFFSISKVDLKQLNSNVDSAKSSV